MAPVGVLEGAFPRGKSVTMGAFGSAYMGDVVTSIAMPDFSEFYLGVLGELLKNESVQCDPSKQCVIYAGEGNEVRARLAELMDDGVRGLACVVGVNGRFDRGTEKGIEFADYCLSMSHGRTPNHPALMDLPEMADAMCDLAERFIMLGKGDFHEDANFISGVRDDYDFSELGELREAFEQGEVVVTSVESCVTFCLLRSDIEASAEERRL